MQANLNCNCPKPQFGMAIHSNDAVNAIIKKRINKDLDKLTRLEDIFQDASRNEVVDVCLHANPDNASISANIYAINQKSQFCKQITENFFTKHFGGGIVGFIEKASRIADDAAPQICKEIQVAERFENSKIFNQ